MNRKITLLMGLAILAALAVIGVLSLLVFRFTDLQPTEASIIDTIKGGPDKAAWERLIDFALFPPVATSVSTGSATVFPDDPGDPSRLTVQFTVSPTGRLDPGDEIIITLEDDFGFEIVLPLVVNMITISASDVTNECVGGSSSSSCDEPVGGPLSNETVRPDGVNVDFTGDENDLAEITATVPDMSTVDGNGIADGATVTVIFHQGAGIVNAREANEYPTTVYTTADTADFTIPGELVVRALLLLEDNDDVRSSKEPLLILGIEGKESVTVWLDNDGDGIRDVTERDLCTVVADADDTAKCTIVLNNPPFFPGTFGAGGTCTIPLSKCNFINFIGSELRTTGFPTGLTQADVDRQTFELEPGPPPPTPTPTPTPFPTPGPGTPGPTPTPTPFPTPTPISPFANLSLSIPLSGPVGTVLRVSGRNFDPLQSVRITFDGQQVALVDVGPGGHFSVSFIVPDVAPGNYQVVVGDTDPIPFVVTPTIHACFKNHLSDAEEQGQLRIVSDPVKCQQDETPISWTQPRANSERQPEGG